MDPRNAVFQLRYDGPALASHEMDVKELAPALLAMGELLEDANHALNGERVKVHVNLKATREGSVDISLSVVQNILDQATSLFSADGVSAIVNAKELLGLIGIGGGGGLIALLKWLRGRPLKNVITLEDGRFQLEIAEGEVRIVSEREVRLFRLFSIRKKLEAVVKTPLSRAGIDTVSFHTENAHEEVRKEEIEFFTAPEVGDEILDEQEVEMSLQIVNISFQDGGKWRFTDGNATFYADIFDKEFLERVQKNEAAFAKDDLIQVRLLRRQSLTSAGIKTDYVIQEVLQHKSAARQIELPFEDGPASSV